MVEDLKVQYCKLLVLNSDLTDNHKSFIKGFVDITSLGKNIKNNTLNLYLLAEVLKDLSKEIRENKYLISRKRELYSYLEFMNHLRNIISGHLDSRVIRNAIQWEPSLFYVVFCEKREDQLNLFYKSLIESAINSYVDVNGKHKVFKGEIDLFYPPNQKELFEYLEKVNTLALSLIESILDEFKSQIEIIKSKDEVLLLAIEASKTDFSINKKK